jgi:hypothetical protein
LPGPLQAPTLTPVVEALPKGLLQGQGQGP